MNIKGDFGPSQDILNLVEELTKGCYRDEQER